MPALSRRVIRNLSVAWPPPTALITEAVLRKTHALGGDALCMKVLTNFLESTNTNLTGALPAYAIAFAELF